MVFSVDDIGRTESNGGVLRLERTCEPTPTDTSPPRGAPTRAEVVAAMNVVGTAIAECRATRHGILYLWLDFASDGTPARVRLFDRREHPFHAMVYECAAERACAVRVPEFRDPAFSLVYPFRL